MGNFNSLQRMSYVVLKCKGFRNYGSREYQLQKYGFW
jgi:hypothetical protein